MRTLVARRLSAHDGMPAVRECLALLSPKVEHLQRMHGALSANLKRIDEIARSAGITVLGGKGISAHATYTDQSVRDFNDIDLFVAGRADATHLARTLREEFGYRYQSFELPWFKLDGSLLYGQIALAAPDDEPDMLNSDIHFGEYSVRHSSRLAITRTFPADSPGLHMLGAEENLACIVNNAAGDYFITAKDTNDLLMGFSLPGFDVDRFVAQLRHAHLLGFFGHIMETLRATSVLTEEQELVVAAIPVERTAEPAPRPDGPNWTLRYVGTTLHAFAAHRHNGVISAAKMAAKAFSYYRKRLKLRIGRPAAPIEYNAWTCIRLVPLDIAASLLADGNRVGLTESRSTIEDGFDRIDTPAGTYVRIGEELFIATVDYRLSPDLIRHAMATASERKR